MRQLLLWTLFVLPLLLVSVWIDDAYHLLTSVDLAVQRATQAAALAAASQTQASVTYDSQGDGTILYAIVPAAAQTAAQATFTQALSGATGASGPAGVAMPGLTTTPVQVAVTSPTAGGGPSAVVVHETATYTVPGVDAALVAFWQGRMTDRVTIPAVAMGTVRGSTTPP